MQVRGAAARNVVVHPCESKDEGFGSGRVSVGHQIAHSPRLAQLLIHSLSVVGGVELGQVDGREEDVDDFVEPHEPVVIRDKTLPWKVIPACWCPD